MSLTVVYILVAILLFGLLVLVHEFGHFLTAKLSGVQVNEFSLFMGPAIWKKQKGETLYSLRCIPIGGYCAMEGEDGDSDNPRAFGRAKVWKRLLILVAGSFMNLVAGLLIMTIYVASVYQAIPTRAVASVDSASVFAGQLQAGDSFYSIGGGAPVSIQSMLNTATTDVEGSLAQIAALKAAGCELARLAVPDQAAAKGFAAIAARSPLPLVADIHFDYRLAIAAAEGGAAKIRINPGNIGGEAHVRAVADCCRAHHIPIRIGVNGGSLEKTLLEKYGHPTPEALVESAFSHIRMLEDVGFGDICVSMKSSNVPLMMQAYRLMHERSDYPLHVGVTETGTEYMGTIKSAMGIGGLLCLGIGDTIRVSLTADPVREVVAAKAILKAAGLRKQGVNLISCPTCGRTKIDLIGLANRVQEALQDCDKELTVAVMGCVVNGPGEAREADIGIAGGDGCGVLFVHGELKEKLPYDELLPALLRYIDAM